MLRVYFKQFRTDLVFESLFGDQFQGLEVRVELGHDRQLYSEKMLDDVAHCDVIREADDLTRPFQALLLDDGTHLLRQRATEAEAGAAGGEPEGDFLLALEEESYVFVITVGSLLNFDLANRETVRGIDFGWGIFRPYL